MIVNLGSKKGKNNDNTYLQPTHLHNSLLMSIVDTPKNDFLLSSFDLVSVTR